MERLVSAGTLGGGGGEKFRRKGRRPGAE